MINKINKRKTYYFCAISLFKFYLKNSDMTNSKYCFHQIITATINNLLN